MAKGKPTSNATKIWLTKNGGCIVASNCGDIPDRHLRYLLEIIAAQYFYIVSKWKEHFCVTTVKFYC